MTESTITADGVLKDLNDSLVQLIEDAEKHKTSASAKNENYKYEFAAGEINAYEEVAKTLKTALSKI
ncbi:MAG: hypothetical protein HN472_11495 [Nitrospina sp.]|jgi:hypothetical protein|nr:hypothetical protein [Nitrospina sp.]MBT3877396.1 hypothetical protein [Nitrospina sp.]MBT4047116.1 hypothetical protein [Nitrospina sp.]MBT4557545.1 hypothetical protein [Nitrospina sp.]MBT5349586.1 hypothetical protein [Nitrospina sp.]